MLRHILEILTCLQHSGVGLGEKGAASCKGVFAKKKCPKITTVYRSVRKYRISSVKDEQVN